MTRFDDDMDVRADQVDAVLPSGRTVFEEVAPAVDRAYVTGVMPSVLQITDGP